MNTKTKSSAFDYKYKFCLYKGYFEKGYMLTNYLKYFIILFGVFESVSRSSIIWTMFGAIIYGIFCFFLGWAWFKYNWIRAEAEVSNRFNYFVQEMRNSKIFKE